MIVISTMFVLIMLIMPLISVLINSLGNGPGYYVDALKIPTVASAFRLTLTVTVITVIINTFFGIVASWLLTRYSFRGKQILATLIDIPFSISPVIAGLAFIMMFGRLGWASPVIDMINDTTGWNVKIVFATPGVILATVFVTFPFISREIIPVLNSVGTDEEEAAALMGAKWHTIFTKVTFPHIKWAFLYGIVLCTARAMGEFGAVSVLSGHLRGKTNTLPLHIEILFNEFQYVSAFAVSSILVMLAIVVLVLRSVLEKLGQKDAEQNR